MAHNEALKVRYVTVQLPGYNANVNLLCVRRVALAYPMIGVVHDKLFTRHESATSNEMQRSANHRRTATTTRSRQVRKFEPVAGWWMVPQHVPYAFSLELCGCRWVAGGFAL